MKTKAFQYIEILSSIIKHVPTNHHTTSTMIMLVTRRQKIKNNYQQVNIRLDLIERPLQLMIIDLIIFDPGNS